MEIQDVPLRPVLNRRTSALLPESKLPAEINPQIAVNEAARLMREKRAALSQGNLHRSVTAAKPQKEYSEEIHDLIAHWNSKGSLFQKLRPATNDGKVIKAYYDAAEALSLLMRGNLIPRYKEKFTAGAIEGAIDTWEIMQTDPEYYPKVKNSYSLLQFLYDKHAKFETDDETNKSKFRSCLTHPVKISVEFESRISETKSAVSESTVDQKALQIVIDTYKKRMRHKPNMYKSSNVLSDSELVRKRSKDTEHLIYGTEQLLLYVDKNRSRTSRRECDFQSWVNDMFECVERSVKDSKDQVFPARFGEKFSLWVASERDSFDTFEKGEHGAVGDTPAIHVKVDQSRHISKTPWVQPYATIFDRINPHCNQEDRYEIPALRQQLEVAKTWLVEAERTVKSSLSARYRRLFFEPFAECHEIITCVPGSPNWNRLITYEYPEDILRRISHVCNPYADFDENAGTRTRASMAKNLMLERLAPIAAEFPIESFCFNVNCVDDSEGTFNRRKALLEVPASFSREGFHSYQELLQIRFYRKYGLPTDYAYKVTSWCRDFLVKEKFDLYQSWKAEDPFASECDVALVIDDLKELQ